VKLSMGLLAVAAGGLGLFAIPARAQQPDDPTSVAIFDAANTYDIEASGLAEKRTKNKDVEALAKQFVHDHSAARQQGRDLAKKLGITPTPPKDFALTKDHMAAMAKLKSASDAQFDRTYLENEVAYHKAVIDAINNVLLPSIKNPELKTLVQQIGPAFNAHLIAAQNLLSKLPQ
jgi:putative membrane protein